MITFLNTIQIVLLIIIAVICSALTHFLLHKASQQRIFSRIDDIYLKLKDNINFAVSPKFIELSSHAKDIIDLAVEVWRMEQRIIKSLSSLPENQKRGIENSIQKIKRYLQKHDIEIMDYTNQKFNDGLNLDVLSVEKDQTVADPIVKETVEPTILHKGQVVRKAKVIVLRS